MNRVVHRVAIAVMCVTVLAAACTTPTTPGAGPVDSGPLPSGTDFVALPWKPADAPRLVSELRNLLADPAFAATLDPATRDATLQSIKDLTDDPDATDVIQRHLEREQQLSGEWTGRGRIPPPPTKEQMLAAGAPINTDSIVPEGPTPTFPDTEAPPSKVAAVGVERPIVDAVTDVIETTVEDSGEHWPREGHPNAWPVATGTRPALTAQEWIEGRGEGGGAGGGDPKAIDCVPGNTGSRHLPIDSIPAYEGRIYTPTQGAYASSGGIGGPHSGQVVTMSGDLQTRMDPAGSGIRQFKVEAHLLSPTFNPLNPLYPYQFELDQFRGHVIVEQLGKTPQSYVPGSAHTEFRTLCYAEDAGLAAAKRGYVEAWIPMSTPGADELTIDEPGFQVRFETIDNYWNGSHPTAFYAADQVTVLQTLTGMPLSANDPLLGGSLALRVDDGLLVDRDQNPSNDLESALKAQVEPSIGTALESFQGSWKYIPFVNAYYWISDVDANSYSLNLDLKPIVTGISPPPNPILTYDDEYQLTASFSVNDLYLEGMFGVGLPCYFHTHLKGSVSASGRVDIDDSDPQSLEITATATVSGVGASGSFASPLPPLCNLFYLVQADFAGGYIENLANEKLKGLLDTKLADPIDLNLDDTLAPGVTMANGNGFGFGFGFAGFNPTCPPRGCHGGDVLMDENGIALMGALSAPDKKPAAAARRFPNLFEPTLGSAISDAYMAATRPNGQKYSVGAFISPTLLNQILRALTEGSSTGTPNGLLDLSGSVGGYQLSVSPTLPPIFVDQQVVGGQLPLTLFVPDLRISDGTNELALNAAVGIDLEIDAETRKLVPSIVVWADFDTLTCNVWGGGTASILTSYALCANNDWVQGGTPTPLLPSIPSALDWAVNTVVPPLLDNSLGQIEIPPAVGFDFVALGDSDVENVNGILSIFVGTPTPDVVPAPALQLQSQGMTILKARAYPYNFPGQGAITYDWKFEDQHSNYVFDPPPNTDATMTPDPAPFALYVNAFGYTFTQKKAKVTVTASRGGTTLTETKVITWNPW